MRTTTCMHVLFERTVATYENQKKTRPAITRNVVHVSRGRFRLSSCLTVVTGPRGYIPTTILITVSASHVNPGRVRRTRCGARRLAQYQSDWSECPTYAINTIETNRCRIIGRIQFEYQIVLLVDRRIGACRNRKRVYCHKYISFVDRFRWSKNHVVWDRFNKKKYIDRLVTDTEREAVARTTKTNGQRVYIMEFRIGFLIFQSQKMYFCMQYNIIIIIVTKRIE